MLSKREYLVQFYGHYGQYPAQALEMISRLADDQIDRLYRILNGGHLD